MQLEVDGKYQKNPVLVAASPIQACENSRWRVGSDGSLELPRRADFQPAFAGRGCQNERQNGEGNDGVVGRCEV